MSLPVMFLAAGFGTRMGALTQGMPKPMLKIAGTPMIDRAIEIAQDAGCAPLVANTHYHAEKLEAHLAERWHGEIRISREEPDILDSGGGLKQAASLLESNTVVTLNADAVWGSANPISRLLHAWNPAEMDALLLMVPVAQAKAYTRAGDFFLDGKHPRRRGDANRAPYVYTGAQIIKMDTLSPFNATSFSLNAVWDRVAANGRLHAAVYDDIWIDVGTPDGLAVADAALKDQL